MLSYEAPPPENGWEELREKLSDSELSLVAERLQACEEAPPAGSWQVIVAGLNAASLPALSAGTALPAGIPPSHARVATLGANFPKRLRRLAAAVILGLLLGGSYYFINTIDQEEKRIAGTPALPANPHEPGKPSAPGQLSPAASQPYSSAAAPAPTNRRPAPASPPAYRNRRYYPGNEGPGNATKLLAVAISERPLHSSTVEDTDSPELHPVSISPGKIYGENGELIQDMSILNPRNSKYVNITAPNGQRTRVSAKLAFAMPYMGPSSADPLNSGNYYWGHVIREWQDKILQSGFVPSSANFLDILEFSEMILE